MEDGTGFIQVAKNKVAKNIPDPSINNPSTSTSNKFSILDVDKPEKEPEIEKGETPATRQTPRILTNSKRITVPKTRPITIKTTPDMHYVLKRLGKRDHCNFQAAPSGEFTRIFPTSPEAYTAIVNELEKEEMQHFVVPEKGINPIKAVIRGLPINTSEAFIQDELKDAGYEVIKVTQMTKFKTGHKMPLFQVQLSPNSNCDTIWEMETLSHFCVRVEKYLRPNRSLQCHKCQFFHHSSQNCRMKPRCVKCGQGHETKDCSLGDKSENKNQIRCANCYGNHTANFRGCKKTPENLRLAREQKIAEQKKLRQNFSYAAVASEAVATPPPPAPTNDNSSSTLSDLTSLKNIMNEIAAELKVNSLMDLIKSYHDLLTEIKNCDTQEEKEIKFLSKFFPTDSSNTP